LQVCFGVSAYSGPAFFAYLTEAGFQRRGNNLLSGSSFGIELNSLQSSSILNMKWFGFPVWKRAPQRICGMKAGSRIL
jgi:hypothetical protein